MAAHGRCRHGSCKAETGEPVSAESISANGTALEPSKRATATTALVGRRPLRGARDRWSRRDDGRQRARGRSAPPRGARRRTRPSRRRGPRQPPQRQRYRSSHPYRRVLCSPSGDQARRRRLCPRHVRRDGLAHLRADHGSQFVCRSMVARTDRTAWRPPGTHSGLSNLGRGNAIPSPWAFAHGCLILSSLRKDSL